MSISIAPDWSGLARFGKVPGIPGPRIFQLGAFCTGPVYVKRQLPDRCEAASTDLELLEGSEMPPERLVAYDFQFR